MKTIGKISILALSCAFVLALAACGGSSGGGDQGGGAPTATDTGSAGSDLGSGGTGIATDDTDGGGTSTAPTSEPGSPEGTISGDTYTNDYFGVTFEPPAGMGLNVQDNQSLSGAPGVYVQYVAAATSGDNININYEDMQATGSAGLSEDEYMAAAYDIIGTSVEGMGAKLENSLITTYTTGSISHPMMELELSMGGISMKESVICIKQGDYLMSITFTGVSDGAIADMMEGLKLTK